MHDLRMRLNAGLLCKLNALASDALETFEKSHTADVIWLPQIQLFKVLIKNVKKKLYRIINKSSALLNWTKQKPTISYTLKTPLTSP